MSIFSGYLNGTTNNMGYFYINDEDQRFNQSDLNILNNTSILPYVRSGGAFTSGTAFSFFKNSNLTLNLTPQQEHAFETGSYGNDIKIIQTDEANSRA
jgi:hypothetical protein